MARAPILPSSRSDPTGADRLERGAMREFDRRIRLIRQAYIDALRRIPAEPVVNKRYTFNLDAVLLASVLGTASAEVDAQLLDGGEQNLWFFESYVAVAYQRGAAQAFANLSRQSPVYLAGQKSLADILISTPYRRRIALIRAREFEEMQGLTGAIKASMTRILTDGIGRGLNPRDIARKLRDQAGIEARRAHRIARTEITTALRRARWDEVEDAQERYGIRSMLLHVSALSPTTRKTHALRHGNLYTVSEVREWYSQDANSINCKCTQIEVMVDENNEPLVPAIVERVRKTYKLMEEKERGPWTNTRRHQHRPAACKCCA